MREEPLGIQTPVFKFVEDCPERIDLLEELEIDFCCGGRKSLEEACAEKGRNPEEVLQRLLSESGDQQDRGREYGSQATMTDLIHHIKDTHHVYTRKTLPLLTQLAFKVTERHKENHPELLEIQRLVDELRQDLEPHMLKEEEVLFPMIEHVEATGETDGFHCGSIQNPIRVIEMEHHRAGELLVQILRATDHFNIPEDACDSYRLLYKELEHFSADLKIHIHKENNILFPRVLRASD